MKDVDVAGSEVRSRSLIEGHPDGVFELDLDGTLVTGNKALEVLTGYLRDELVGRSFDQLVHPADLARVRGEFEVAARGGSGTYDMVVLRKDGSSLVAGVTSVPVVVDGEAVGVYGIARDVSEQKATAAALAASEAELRGMFDSAATSIAVATPAGAFLRVNAAYCAMLGYTEHELLALNVEQVLHPDDREANNAAIAELLAGRQRRFVSEKRYLAKDGTPVWVRASVAVVHDADGTPRHLVAHAEDITGQRLAAREIEQLAERLTATMESITDALYTLDGQWQFTYVNAHAERLLQRSRASLLGRSLWDEFPDAVGTRLYDVYHSAVAEQTTLTVEEFYYEPLSLWLEARAYPSTDGLTVYFRDISEKRAAAADRAALLAAERKALEHAQQAQRTIAHQASHDPLTGLHNRNAIISRLETAEPAGYTLLLLDLDGFRQVNDGLGQTGGNELLNNVARLLQDLIRRDDTVARVGGDEFAVLLPGHDPEAANQIAERILERLRTPMEIAGRRLRVTASIGISQADPTVSGEVAIRDADVALYRAKDAGRNRSIWYDPMLQQQVSQRLTAAAELHDAVETDQLILHFQPAFDLTTGRAIGAEALVRWQHPERGLIPPGLFIPVAEETGLIEPMGEWCLITAVDTARAWNRIDENFTVWVNVAVHQLRRAGLAANIRRLLDTTGTRPHQLGIEITESAFANDPAIVLAELDAISALGVKIAIDDFGTGYSSLSRLSQLPIDLLKIDRSFINALDTPSGAATVAAIIDLAHATALEVIAEGVETPGQLAILRDAGCDQVSGFLLARPDRADQLSTASAAGSTIIQTIPPTHTTADQDPRRSHAGAGEKAPAPHL